MKELRDVNQTWLNYTVVMYSPTITAGISFEQKHFDKVFCYFTNMSCDVLSCIQMIGRVRDVGDREINICLESHFHRASITKAGIEKDLVDGRNELLSIPFNDELQIDSDYDDDDNDVFYLSSK